ncbi:MAG: hypothetical protein RLY31_579 [Bacteroidota bacterium]|jgi:hypothetical protein
MTCQARFIATALLMLLTVHLSDLTGQWEAGVAWTLGGSFDWKQREGLAGMRADGPAEGYSLSASRLSTVRRIRLQVGPGIRFTKVARSYRESGMDERTSWSGHSLAGLFLRARLYFLDMEGACDCPTFSRRGSNALKQGLFVELDPQGGLSWHRFVSMESDHERAEHWQIAAGLGWDFPSGSRVQATPLLQAAHTRIRYRKSPGESTGANDWAFRLGIQIRLRQPDRA